MGIPDGAKNLSKSEKVGKPGACTWNRVNFTCWGMEWGERKGKKWRWKCL